MNDEQKAQALALYRNERIWAAYGHCPTRYVRAPDSPGGQMWQIQVPDLADGTGEVEGRLHRVLERLAGEAVEVCMCDDGWRAARVVTWPKDLTARDYPTRLDAIVAALLEVAK